MPNRIIRESCRTSKTLAKISGDSERLFWRITTTADDFGRFEADSCLVRAACLPTLLERYSETQTEVLIQELVSSGLISLYVVEDRRYGVLLTWFRHQTPRAKHSKHPSPPDNICKQMQSYADIYARDRDRERDRERERDRGIDLKGEVHLNNAERKAKEQRGRQVSRHEGIQKLAEGVAKRLGKK